MRDPRQNNKSKTKYKMRDPRENTKLQTQDKIHNERPKRKFKDKHVKMKRVLFWFFLQMNSVALTDGRKWDFLKLEKQTNFHPPELYNGLNFEIQDRLQ